MNKDLLRRHIQKFAADARRDPGKFERDLRERADAITYYRQFVPERILAMTAEDVYDYLSRLWANLIWGNNTMLSIKSSKTTVWTTSGGD